jgi:hypothetical protein
MVPFLIKNLAVSGGKNGSKSRILDVCHFRVLIKISRKTGEVPQPSSWPERSVENAGVARNLLDRFIVEVDRTVKNKTVQDLKYWPLGWPWILNSLRAS